ncbi:zinc finger protein 676-like isoform X2 [Battus philenor]|uniref:zinc finger protein 676-like isoform X2 n=1 Tax=Battus philenor TaxID=42288 RepID=UPI0035CF55F4
MASPSLLDPSNKTPQNSFAEYQSRKLTTIDLVGGIHCHICLTTFGNKKDYDSHYAQHDTGAGIVYTCVLCHKSINGYPSFRGHCYTSHVVKAKYRCDNCKKQFSKWTALKDHINIMHKFKCTTCGKEFQTKKEMQIHQIIHNNSDSPPYSCQSCERQIDSLDGCEYHIDLHSSFTYCCPICSENSNSKQAAVEHLKQHFGTECLDTSSLEVEDAPDDDFIEKLGGILCCICSTVHRNRVNYDAHFSLMHGCQDIVYTCNECNKQFDKYSMFGNHCYNHFMKNRFECDQCGKAFPRLSLLATHTEAYHVGSSSGPKPFACGRCDHRFGTQRALRAHLREQHNVTCVQCPQEGCERIFETPKELVFHQRHHDKSQNWCRQCGLHFSSLSSCEKHLDAHRKKSYSCPVCNRNYGEKHAVIKHVSKHFETVVHICKVCGKVYNAKNRLVEHIKVHSDVKTHTCTHCGKGFVKLGQLEQHLNVHTGVRPYKCSACPKTFASYANLHKHSRRMHNIDTKDIKKAVTMIANEVGSESSTDASSSKESTVSSEPEYNKNDDPFKINISDTNLKTFKLFESDDSTMESDSIDPVVIEKELQIFEAVNELPTNNLFLPAPEASLVTEQPGSSAGNFPLEYGPEFNTGLHGDGAGFIDLDDHILPHIDPLLTINNDQPLHAMYVQSLPDFQGFEGNLAAGFEADKWEPLITKVYQDYACGYDVGDAGRLSVMNTDIF